MCATNPGMSAKSTARRDCRHGKAEIADHAVEAKKLAVHDRIARGGGRMPMEGARSHERRGVTWRSRPLVRGTSSENLLFWKMKPGRTSKGSPTGRWFFCLPFHSFNACALFATGGAPASRRTRHRPRRHLDFSEARERMSSSLRAAIAND